MTVVSVMAQEHGSAASDEFLPYTHTPVLRARVRSVAVLKLTLCKLKMLAEKNKQNSLTAVCNRCRKKALDVTVNSVNIQERQW